MVLVPEFQACKCKYTWVLGCRHGRRFSQWYKNLIHGNQEVKSNVLSLFRTHVGGIGQGT